MSYEENIKIVNDCLKNYWNEYIKCGHPHDLSFYEFILLRDKIFFTLLENRGVKK